MTAWARPGSPTTGDPAGGIEWIEDSELPRSTPARQAALIEAAIGRRPESAGLHGQLGLVLLELGRPAEAVASFRRSQELDPDSWKASLGVARALEAMGLDQEALSLLRELVVTFPRQMDVCYGLGRALVQADRFDEALVPLHRATELDPLHFPALHHLLRVLVRRGALGEARAALEENLQRFPGNAGALGLKSQILLELGLREEAAHLLGYDRFLQASRLATPEGYTDLGSFNDALAASIRGHPALRFQPPGLATRGGTQTTLAAAGDRPETTLYRMVQAAMEDYRRRVYDATHPFAAAAPGRARLKMWTVVLQKGGHQVPHVHPEGWLSAVYYVKVPAGEPGEVGPLELGSSDVRLGMRARPDVRLIVPESGLLLLFPSYYYHRTIPTRAQGERICVAFNMLVR